MTRSMAAVDIAVQEPGEKVFVFGNAPTALFRLLEHRETAIGGVVGCRSGSSARRSRKRRSARAACRPSPRSAAKGSNVAAAIVNALLYHLREAQ